MNEVAPTKKTKAALTEQITFTPEQLQLMKTTVAKGATDDEFLLLLHLAKTYGLDPFAKEIWCIKYVPQGRDPRDYPATIFSSRDGYLKIASRDPQMDGIQSDVVCENDKLKKQVDGTVKHTYGNPRGLIIGAYALVFRKDRSRPAYFYAPFGEYGLGRNPTWKNYPSAMIVKVAEAMALKRAFSISGLVTQEELGLDAPIEEAETSAVVVEEAAPAPMAVATAAAPSAEEAAQLAEVVALIEEELKSRHVTKQERNRTLAGLNRLTLPKAQKSLSNLRDTIDFRPTPQGVTAAKNQLLAFAEANATALGQEAYNYLKGRATALTVTAVDVIHDMQVAEQRLKSPHQAAA